LLGASGAPIDPRLAAMIDAWPNLTEPMKDAVAGMVEAAAGKKIMRHENEIVK